MTEAKVWLDWLGDANLPDEATLIASEVEFLRHAPEGKTLLVRGRALCQWAAEFYRGRAAAVQDAYSPIRALQRVISDLSDDQARELLDRLGDQWAMVHDRGLSARGLLEALYPMGPWSDEAPSRQHVAAWLLWLFQHKPSTAIQVVMNPLLTDWRNAAITPERALYEASDAKAAHAILCNWLAISDQTMLTNMGEFPEEVPNSLLSEAREVWQRRIVETDGTFFDTLAQRPIPRRLLRIAAEETAAYVEQHSQRLSAEQLRALAPLLNSKQRQALARFAPPPQPGSLPTSVPEMLRWFEQHYLPYRRWQTAHGREEDAAVSAEALRHFADWYLAHYPPALTGGPLRDYLSFRQLLHLPDDSACTLMIVLDGLHAEDALQLRQLVEELAPQLDWLEAKWVFAPLPTVTSFAKPALLAGLPPAQAVGEPPLAEVLPERKNPAKRLATTDGGQRFFWRVMDPDDTYHNRNYYDSLPEEVEAALQRIAKSIARIVREVPEEVTLRIVLTSDHGRLLDKVPRTIPVPEGMTSHGRAAWGERHHDFADDRGVIIEEDVAFLHGSRFGLPDDVGEVAVIIGPHMFKTNNDRTGAEAYPHGGLSPEEIIVPWWVLERGWQPPRVVIAIRGQGIAGGQGRAAVQVVNPGDMGLALLRLHLRGPRGDEQAMDVNLAIGPRAKAESAIPIAPWPSPADAIGWTAEATLQLSGGKRFTIQPTVELISEEMYGRDNILEDLL